MTDSQTEPSDAILMKAAQQDIDAFDALYHRYVDRVFRYCYARTHVASTHLSASGGS